MANNAPMTLTEATELDLPSKGIPAVAKHLGVSEHTLRRLVEARAIPHHRVGSLIRFTQQDLQDYVNQTPVDAVS